MMKIRRGILVGLMSMLLVLPMVAPVWAGWEKEDRTPIGLDIFVLRPLGMVSLLIGGVVYVVSYPFAGGTNSADVTGEELLMKPWRFTFERPMGGSTFEDEILDGGL